MQITDRHRPSFGVARIALSGGERVKVEAGAMMATSGGVTLEAKAEGGFFKSLKRAALGGESFFVTTYTAPSQGGWVDVAPRLPGDLLSLNLTAGSGMVVQKGSWLASAMEVEFDTKWGGFKNMFGSEGGFVVRASGSGPLLIACYGALDVFDLQPGETVTVDTGHMVAYQDSVQMTLRKVTGGLVQSFKSGEGIVFDFTGPGKVWTQSRNPNELLSWITASMPNTGANSGGGGLGSLLGSRD